MSEANCRRLFIANLSLVALLLALLLVASLLARYATVARPSLSNAHLLETVSELNVTLNARTTTTNNLDSTTGNGSTSEEVTSTTSVPFNE